MFVVYVYFVCTRALGCAHSYSYGRSTANFKAVFINKHSIVVFTMRLFTNNNYTSQLTISLEL